MSLTEIPVSSTEHFVGSIISLCVDQVRLPDGSLASRECVLHPGGAAVLAVTQNSGRWCDSTVSACT